MFDDYPVILDEEPNIEEVDRCFKNFMKRYGVRGQIMIQQNYCGLGIKAVMFGDYAFYKASPEMICSEDIKIDHLWIIESSVETDNPDEQTVEMAPFASARSWVMAAAIIMGYTLQKDVCDYGKELEFNRASHRYTNSDLSISDRLVH